MKFRTLGKTGYTVSAVSYGGIVSAKAFGGALMPGDGQANSDGFVSWAIDQGVNYFDVAPSYGDAQLLLGNSLRPYRQKVYLACKTGKRTRDEAEAELHESLRLLHTDFFDVYQMHGLSTMEELEVAFGPGGVMELMRAEKEKGTLRKVSFTAHSEKVALQALELYDFDTVLFPFNWHMHMAHGMGARLLQVAKEKGVAVLCMKSMIERAWDQTERFSSHYPKSWCKPFDIESDAVALRAAVHYALSLGVDTIIPPGNFDHFRFAVEHIDALVDEPFTDQERQLLEQRLAQVANRPFFDESCYQL